MNPADTYTAQALAALRYRVATTAPGAVPDLEDDPAAEQAYLDMLNDEAAQYAEDLIRNHEMATEDWQDNVDVDEDGEPLRPPPDMFAAELAAVSRRIAELEAYRRCLVIFGDQYAPTPYGQRQMAKLARVDPASINRWLKEYDRQLRQRVHTEVRPFAAQVIQDADVSQLDGDWLGRLIHAELHVRSRGHECPREDLLTHILQEKLDGDTADTQEVVDVD